MQEVLIYISNGYADWEIGYLGAQIKASDRYLIKTVSDRKDTITSMGGLRVIPDYDVTDVLKQNINDFKMLILCGGDYWGKEHFSNSKVISLVEVFRKNHLTVAAICDAVTFLCYNNYLNDIKHTGNSLEYLISTCPTYKGRENYINKQCVATKGFITANGTAALEFTRAIMESLSIESNEKIDAWYHFHKTGFYPE